MSVTEAAKVRVSRQTLHAWLGRYAGSGLEGLADRSHRPRWCPHQMSAVAESRLVELRMLHPGWGGAAGLPAGSGGVRPGAECGRDRARAAPACPDRRASSGRAAGVSPLAARAGDETVAAGRDGRLRLVDGSELNAVTGIDDHSRFCVAFGLVQRATARPVCAVFAAALQTHGVPKE